MNLHDRASDALSFRSSRLRRRVSAFLLLTIILGQVPLAPAALAGPKAAPAVEAEPAGRAAAAPAGRQSAADTARSKQETQEERDATVSRIRVDPEGVTAHVNQRVPLGAFALAANGVPVGGVRLTWRVSAGPDGGAEVSQDGTFVAKAPGVYEVTAEGASQAGVATVTVVDGGGKGRATASNAVGGEALAVVDPLDESRYIWNEDNFLSARRPHNQRGERTEHPPAINGNFSFVVPVLSAPGRGMSLDLNMTYNSRVWNVSGSEITYNIDRDWPAPGWSFSLPKLAVLGEEGAMLIGGDGTRHPFFGKTTFTEGTTVYNFKGHTTDGTFVKYDTNASGSGTVRYPNGTVISFSGSLNSKTVGYLYPTSIRDVHGNTVTIRRSTTPGMEGAITSIADTLGRAVFFYYDSRKLLTAITTAGPRDPYGNVEMRTLVRFHYRKLRLSYSFTGLTPLIRNSEPYVIDAVYYPATNTGYWFGDQDSYSFFGMIRRVEQQRGMSFIPATSDPGAELTTEGQIVRGEMTSRREYDYPLTASVSFAGAPSYTEVRESWAGMTGQPRVTKFEAHMHENPRRVKITRPDNTYVVQLSDNRDHLAESDPLKFHDGLLLEETLYAADGTALSKSRVVDWALGDLRSPRPTRIENYLYRKGTLPPLVSAQEVTYGAQYNTPDEKREYGFDGALIRRTRTTFRHIENEHTQLYRINLVASREVFSGLSDATRVSYMVNNYDENPLPALPPGVVQFFNGPTPRGNLTSTTSYADALGATGAATTRYTYDVFGNLTGKTSDSGVPMTYVYDAGTQYAFPSSVITGKADSTTRLVTSTAYDFNTGLPTAMTDANGRQSRFSYDPATTRRTRVVLPSGAYSQFSHDDSELTLTTSTYLAEGGARVARTVEHLNGIGQVLKAESQSDGNQWSTVEVEYDEMNRVARRTRPYFPGETPQWRSYAYDGLGRTTSTTGADGSVVRSFYDEAPGEAPALPAGAGLVPGRAVRSVDAWGRSRWGLLNSDGQLVEVVEALPEGDGQITGAGLLTKYFYDSLDRLVRIEQGPQRRKFRYDGLGRMTHAKMAEKAATLNDAGQYVGPTPEGWSGFYHYDTKGNLDYSTDARGVVVSFNFGEDPLNRLQSAEYTVPAAHDTSSPIPPAPKVSYTYMPNGDQTRTRQVITAPVAADGFTSPGSTEELAYDPDGRLRQKTLTFDNMSTQPLVVNYEYDALGRLKGEQYPEQYGTNQQRKTVSPTHTLGHQTGLLVNGTAYVSEAKYNAAGQITTMKVGPAGLYQDTESFDYDHRNGLVIGQKVQRGGQTLLDLTYDYLRAGNAEGRTGQLTRVLDNLDHSKDRAYEYDALGRIKQVTGGAGQWSQQYHYDRFGNRDSVSVTGALGAASPAPPTPYTQVLEEVASRGEAPTLEQFYTADRSSLSDTPLFSMLSRDKSFGAAAGAAAPAPAFADWNAQFVSHNLPPSIPAGTFLWSFGEFVLRMQNTGSQTWFRYNSNAVRVCRINFPENRDNWQAIEREGFEPIHPSVPANAVYNFEPWTSFRMPLRAGVYKMQWQMCRVGGDGTGPATHFGNPSPVIQVNVTPTLKYDAVYVSHNVPAEMNLGQTYAASVTLKNNGTSAWMPNSQTLNSLTTGFDSLLPDGVRVPLTRQVNPGENVEISFPVTAPLQPGAYKTKWQIGNNEFGQPFGDTTPDITVQVVNPPEGALYTTQVVPTRMVAGQTYPVTVTMKNTGAGAWTPAATYKLGSRDPDNNMTWGRNRVDLPLASVATGIDATFSFEVTAPSTPGTHGFQWGMVRESSGQFFGEPSERVAVQVVAPGSPTPTPTPRPSPTPTPVPRVNVALDFNGGVASASSVYPFRPERVGYINDGNRIGLDFGSFGFDRSWEDDTANDFPDWAEVRFDRVRRVSEIDVLSRQDVFGVSQLYPPTLSTLFVTQGNTAFDLYYWNDATSAWVPVPGAQVVGNDRVWRRFNFPEINTSKIRVYVNAALGGKSSLAELEAFELVQPTPTPTPTPAPTPEPNQWPLNLAPAPVPGVIQAEDFDMGGEGVAYRDADAPNNGGAYRGDVGVDIEATTDAGGGYYVGWTSTDEWLEYTIKAPTTGLYKLEARVASPGAGRRLRFDFDGLSKSGEMVVPDTGGWQSWQTINSFVTLQAGVQVMRAYVTSGGFNLNYVRLTALTPNSTPANLAAGKLATQSSDYGAGYTASRAVDNNTDGNSAMGSVSSTVMANQSWWQVDLGNVQAIDNVQVWNRTDCCTDRLADFHVFVSDAPFASTDLAATLAQPGVSHIYFPGQSSTVSTLTVNRAGRYVRVQLDGANYLSMAEVQVWGGAAPVAGGLLADDFNDNARDQLKWFRIDPTSTVVVEEANQRLQITAEAASATHDGYGSVNPVDLTDARAVVEVPHASTGQYTETQLSLWASANSGAAITARQGNLFLQLIEPGQCDMCGPESVSFFNSVSYPYSATQHRFWRIRHDGASDTIKWEASADGGTWQVLRSAPRTFAVNGLQARLTAGNLFGVTVFGGGTPPASDAAFFDNFKVELNNPNTPPTVSLTAPAGGSAFTAPAAIGLRAAADDAEGPVAKVEFYSGAAKLGEDTSAPFEFNWTNVAAGSYTLTATAIDNRGAATTSAPASVTVTPPSINVTATARAAEPSTAGAFNVTRSGGTAQPLTVSLSYGGTATAGTDYSALPPTVTLPAGQSSQTVPVTPVNDSLAEGKETVVITVSAVPGYVTGSNSTATVELLDDENVPPAVTLTAPKSGSSFTPPLAGVDLAADASDADGAVAKVEFFSGTTKLGEDTSAPYGITWANVTTGGYSFTAKVTDDRGATSTSAAAAVTVTNVAALADDFNDNAADLSKWTVVLPAGGTVSEQNQRLELTPPANTAGYSGYVSKPHLDLTGGRASVEVVQTTQLVGGIETYFTLYDPQTGNQLLFVTGGALSFYERTNGVVSTTAAAYDPVQMRHWRIRHDPAADTVNWETSPDGVNWTARRTSPRSFPLTNLQVHFYAGKYAAGVPASTAVFDNFRASRYYTLADEFNDLTPGRALLVVASTALSPSDAALKARLEALGFTVTTKDADTAAAGDAAGKALLVISESVVSATVNTKFRDVGVPALVMEMQVFDDMQMTGPALGSDYNSEGGHTQVVISNPTHPLAAGLTGTATVTTSPINFGWGRPAASAARVATMSYDSTKFTVFGYEAGATMVGLAAPARRVGLFPMANAPALLNSNGWALFDAAARWAANTGALNATRWQYTTPASAAAVTVADQQLRITLQPNTPGSYGVRSAATYDLTGRVLRAEAVQTVSQSGSAWMTMQARLDDNNYYSVTAGAGSLVLEAMTSGAKSRTTVAFDPARHRHWRLRHDAALDAIRFETSANGKNWETLKTVRVGFALGALRVLLTAGANDNRDGWPGAAVFDNVVIQLAEPNLPPTVSITAPAEGTTYFAPASEVITANASDPDGSVVKVEFFSNGTKLGEDTTAPYSFTVTNAAAGNYTLTAKATDNYGATAEAAASGTPQALFVVATTALNAGDAALKARLEALGFTVAVKDAASSVSADAAGKSLVVISETCQSAAVNSKFRDAPAPALVLEPQVFDDMQLTGPTAGADFNGETGQTQVVISNPSHALAAGLTGTVTVTSAPAIFAWGKPAASAARVATLVGDSTKYAAFGYEAGATMMGLAAPARRVGLLPMAETAASFNGNGWALFDAAARWAANVTAPVAPATTTSAPVNVTVSNPSVTVTATDPNASEQGPNTGQFTVKRTGPTGAALSVNLSAGGTATAGSDYTALPAALTIPAGADSAVVQVSPVDDTAVESDETVVLNVTAGASYTVGAAASAAVTITDNDLSPPSIIIINPTSGATFVSPAAVAIDTLTPYTGNPINKVEFLVNDAKIGEDLAAPFSFNWANVAPGSYTLTAKATTESSAFTQLPLANPGFESPALGNGFQYNPTGGPWTLQFGSGISGNSSGFTNGNPPAPTGTQVAFIQNASSYFSQQVSGFEANTNYSITFAAAQRGNCCNAGGQDFDVYLDATLLGTFKPAGTSYAAMATPFFQTTAGSHTLKFVGRNTAGGDNTAFVDDVRVLGAPRQALFVVATTALNAGDAALKARLEALGFTVTVKDAASSVSADAAGKSLVVISETCQSAAVNSKFRDAPAPALVLEPQVFDDMQLTGPTAGADFNGETGQTQVIISNPSHALAAGLTGTVTVTSAPAIFAWGKPAASAARVATLVGDSTKYAAFGYEAGATMMGLAAPARRVGLLPMAETAASFNGNGWALFDAAARWAANITATSVTATSAPVNITVNKPTVTVAASDANASEAGPDPGSFIVARDGGLGTPLTVQFAAGGTATGDDYSPVGTSVTIPAGASSAVVQVTPTDDINVETGGETLTLTLVGNSAYTVGQPSTAAVQIADNDTHPPTVALVSPVPGASFTAPASVQLAASASDPDGGIARVEFHRDGVLIGTATAAPYAMRWADVGPGLYSLTAVAFDNTGNSTTSAPVGVTVTLPTVTVAASDANASEAGPDTGVFTFTRDGDPGAPLGVNYEIAGTAAGGADYTSLAGHVTFQAGASTAEVQVVPLNDKAPEPAETVVVTVGQSPAYKVGQSSSAAVNIADDDDPPGDGAQGRVNVALAANGATASASSVLPPFSSYAAANAINGSRTYQHGHWSDSTMGAYPDWLEVTFAGAKTIDEIDVYGLQDNFGLAEPDEVLTSTQMSLTDFDLKYWNASAGAWVSVPGASVAANNKVWRRFVFAPVTTDKIRLTVYNAQGSWSRVAEVEVYEATSLALGKAATQSSTFTNYNPTGDAWRAVDGNTGGDYSAGSVTHTQGQSQEWWQVDLGSVQDISSVKLWNRTDCCSERLTDFHVFVSDHPFTSNTVAGTQVQPGVTDYHVPGAAGAVYTQPVHRPGRYVRVQLSGTGIVSLAEVEVWRDSPGSASACQPSFDLPLELFVRNFYEAALARQPSPAELQQASDQLRNAHAQGSPHLLSAAQTLGRSLFFGPEYTARNRSNRDFVWDLYWAYFAYGPDQYGWDFWTNDVNKWGREAKITAFDTWLDFTNQLGRICPDLPYRNVAPAPAPGGPYTGASGSPVQFNGAASSDPDGTLVAQQWNFADGLTATGLTPLHTYDLGGTRSVMLMVKDNRGALRGASTTATIQGPQSIINSALFISQSVPATMTAGQTYPVTVTMRNTGTSTWTADTHFLLGAANPLDSTVWKVSRSPDGRVRLPHAVEPDAEVTFTFNVIAPSAPGRRNFQRRMVRHGAEWFGDLTTNVEVNVVGPVVVPADGFTSLAYDVNSNRITTAGFEYDAEGNQTRVPAASGGGGWQRMRYDAAGRLVQVLDDAGAAVSAAYSYAMGGERVTSYEGGVLTYHFWSGSGITAEYVVTPDAPNTLRWSKNNIYFLGGVLATQTAGSGDSEVIEFHHPDRLGTRVVTNPTFVTSYEQVNLPFGNEMTAESTGSNQKRFTSYDRGHGVGLDYAVNRFYSWQQGRFTQADPLEFGASTTLAPQSLNLYAYAGNDPINNTDPDGQSIIWPSFFSFGIGFLWGGSAGGFQWRTIVNGQHFSDWFRFGGPPNANGANTDQSAATLTREVFGGGLTSGHGGGGQTSTYPGNSLVNLTDLDIQDGSSDGSVKLFPYVSWNVSRDLYKAIKELRSFGIELQFTELFRPTRLQEFYYAQAQLLAEDYNNRSWVRKMMSDPPLPGDKPGTSAHEAGYAIDLKIRFLNEPYTTEQMQAIKTVLKAYNFIERPGDPVHFDHTDWINMSPEERTKAIKEAQAYYTGGGLQTSRREDFIDEKHTILRNMKEQRKKK